MPHMQLEFDFGMNLGRAPKPARNFSGSNLFLALRPPFDVQDTAYAIGRDASNRYGLTTTLRPKEILHVSLVGLGAFDQVPSEMIENMKRVISRVSFNDFEVMFDQLMSFEIKPAKPLVLCDVAENRMLIDLRRALRDVVNNQVGRKVITSSYKPHMTLLYDHAVVPRTQVSMPVNWTVNEFWLVRSYQGETKYDYLHPFKSKGSEPPEFRSPG